MTTNNMKVNKLALTWWIYITLIPGYAFAAFTYAGFSSKDRKLVYCALMYYASNVFSFLNQNIVIIAWLVGIIHAFSIKNKYIARRLELKSKKMNMSSSLETNKKTNEDKKEIVKIKIEEESKEETTTKIMQQDNVVEENKTVKLDLGKESNGLVDINYCTEEELEKIPFINSIVAKKAIKQREAIGSFSSVEEFGISIGLKPHIIEKIRPLVVVREISMKENKTEKGRVIDL